MTRRNPQVIALMGSIARIGDDGLEDNPHAEGTGAWHVWRYGWHAKDRREAAGATGKQDKAVSRETVIGTRGEERVSATGKEPKAERDGATWSAGELEALELCAGWIGDRELGAMLGRSQRAVITARARVKAISEAT